MVAISLASIAASVLLLGVYGSVETTDMVMNTTIAQGLAQQLLDEAVGNPYIVSGGNAYAVPIGPPAADQDKGTRQLFAQIGDFNGYVAQPPCDPWGIALGTDDGQGGTRYNAFQAPAKIFSAWKEQVTVSYVSASAPTTPLASGTSDYRLVQVQILYVDPIRGPQVLATAQQVVMYLPALQ